MNVHLALGSDQPLSLSLSLSLSNSNSNSNELYWHDLYSIAKALAIT